MGMNYKKGLVPFQWEDPLCLESLLSEEERLIRDAAREFCQDRLMPRILEANRHEHFDREIMNEAGAQGFHALILGRGITGLQAFA